MSDTRIAEPRATLVLRVGVLTISDRGARGERVDESGPAVETSAIAAGHRVVRTALVADERDEIEQMFRSWCAAGFDVIFSTGGTGFGPRDVTPEATRAVIDREAPGLAELMRAHGLRMTPRAALSRQVCGLRGSTLIVNLPGSPKGALESLEAIIDLLPHAVAMMRGIDA